MTVDTNATELLPCPFCGGDALERTDGPYFIVCCQKCDAEQAREVRRVCRSAWNRRTPYEFAVRKAGEVQRLEALALEYRITLEMIQRHDGSSFYGPEGKKNERAQWRGIMRRVRQVLAASMPDQHAEALRRLADK